MIDLNQLAEAVSNLNTPDDKVQKRITKYFDEFNINCPVEYVQGLFTVLTHKPELLNGCLALLIFPYRNSLKAYKLYKTGDSINNYCIIPPEQLQQYLTTLHEVLSVNNESVRNCAVQIIAISITMLLYHEITPNPLEQVLQSVTAGENSEEIKVCYLNVLSDFFGMQSHEADLVRHTVSILLPMIESSPSVPIANALIGVVSQLTPYFQTIFTIEQPEFIRLLQSLIQFTQIDELLQPSLDFWLSLCQEWYQWLSIASELIDFIVQLISSDDAEVSWRAISIMDEIILAEAETEGESCLQIAYNRFDSLLQPLLAISLSIDTEFVETNEIFDTALACLLNLIMNSSVISEKLPAIWEFVQNGISSSEPEIEVSLRIMNAILEMQADESILPECLEAAVSFAGSENQRIQYAALNLLTSIVKLTSDETLTSLLSEDLLNLCSSETTEISQAAGELIESICSLPSFENHSELFQELYNLKTVGSLNCAYTILNKFGSSEWSSPYLADASALASLALEENKEQLAAIALVIAKESLITGMPDSRPFSIPLYKIAKECYEKFDIPEAIQCMAACTFAEGTSKLLPSTMNVILNYTDELAERVHQSLALSSITFYISKIPVNLENYVGQIGSNLLRILSSVQSEPESKPEAFDAINNLFKYHQNEMMLFFDRFVNVVFTAIESVDKLLYEDKNRREIGESLADSMITINEINPSDDTIAASLAIIQFNIGVLEMSQRLAIDTLKLIECLIKIAPENMKNVASDGKLIEFFNVVVNEAPAKEVQELAINLANTLGIQIDVSNNEQ
ncbi:hypothetical protein TVAG_183010 [Trichomonas vaginalis G3]|uniref:Importin N-terminal domain-containing protein n=1 Tax=Trichomonas vaginalis (strain ATCC PRA-98 / G3) TaxID=412133 RepID=A2D939_TRIV3|nr:armadillo (ARM) repeat-containing protein family [Trichomonas vaginalis G3]EAY23065.1 hypothetical protein TVAG_183010 [Trichomonas vaginalis G3]KAI5519033.1 armadillo (ARM) repeat-containing protein family [Trichomonas vaginalis G3]|eukprot:XP_001584051.1 hypothetical protein [Trichomonas vaginalis G3]